MNATVTKSAKKSIVAKTAKKPANKATVPAKAKPSGKAAVKATLKKVANKVAKTITNALKPSAKTTKAVAKPAVKPATKAATKTKAVKVPAKSPAKPVAKAAARKTPPKQIATVVEKKTSPAAKTSAVKITNGSGQPSASVKQPIKPVLIPPKRAILPQIPAAVIAGAKTTASGARASVTKAVTGLADKIEKTVVSKVSEVATKTTKSPPAVTTDGALLTEAQILKMSDKDYMNAAQLAFFKARLQQLEKDLLKNAGETTEHLRETVLVPDPADRATIEEEHALELRTRDRERKLLKKVQQSIASIDSGDYGWCEETGEPIGIPRLLARPTATLSLEAQQRRELKQKLYGD